MNSLEIHFHQPVKKATNEDLRTAKRRQSREIPFLAPSPLRKKEHSSVSIKVKHKLMKAETTPLVSIEKGKMTLKNKTCSIDDVFIHDLTIKGAEQILATLSNGNYLITQDPDKKYYLVVKTSQGSIKSEILPRNFNFKYVVKYCRSQLGGINLIDKDTLRCITSFQNRTEAHQFLENKPVGSFIFRHSPNFPGAIIVEKNDGEIKTSSKFDKISIDPEIPIYEQARIQFTLPELLDMLINEKKGLFIAPELLQEYPEAISEE